jgi:hypothetical protein
MTRTPSRISCYSVTREVILLVREAETGTSKCS